MKKFIYKYLGILREYLPKQQSFFVDVKKIREAWGILVQKIKFHYFTLDWKIRQYSREVILWIQEHSSSIKRFFLVLVSLTIAHFAVIKFINISSVEPEVLADYFMAVGAMIGGIVAIVFSISIFAQQSARDISSSVYFEEYTRGWDEKIIYSFVVIIAMLFFGLALLFNGQEIANWAKESSIYFSFLLIGLVFVLIDWHYQNVSSKQSSLKAISYLQKKALAFLRDTHKDAKRISKLLLLKEKDASESMAISVAYNQYLQPQLNHLDRQIENLFEIALRLSARQEVMTTNGALAVIRNILIQYLDVRKDSSIALMSSISFFALESDSQSFLTKSFERLNNIGQKFMKEGKIDNAIFVVNIYESLAIKAGGITFTGKEYDNPIFDHITGYLGFLTKFAIEQKELDVILSVVRALKKITTVPLSKGLHLSLMGIQKSFLDIATFGITAKTTFITDEAVSGWQKIIGAVFYLKFFNARHQISETLEKMGQVTELMHSAIISGYLPRDFINKLSLGKPYDEMYMIIASILKFYFDGDLDEDTKQHYRTYLIELFEQIYRNIRRLSEKITILDNSLTTSIGTLLFNINSTIIRLLDDGSFAREKRKLKERLYTNIHLPGFLFNYSGSFKANRLESLTESVVKTGILLFQRTDSDDLILDCLNSLHWIVKKGLEKCEKGYGYDEPRTMLKICYIGILALKQSKKSLLADIKVKILEFEVLFKAKYLSNLPPGIDPDSGNIIGLPKSNQLFIEFLQWRDDFVRERYGRGMMNDAQEMMHDFVDEADIDRFMFEIWGTIPEYSPIEREVEKKLEKQALIKRLLTTLKS